MNEEPIIKTVQKEEVYYIQFTEEEMERLGIHPRSKFTVNEKDGYIEFIPWKSVEIELEELDKETLVDIIEMAIERDVSPEEVIVDAIKSYLDNCYD